MMERTRLHKRVLTIEVLLYILAVTINIPNGYKKLSSTLLNYV